MGPFEKITFFPPDPLAVATKTPVATAMAGAPTTMNNILKAVAATAMVTATMTAMTMTMKTKSTEGAAAA